MVDVEADVGQVKLALRIHFVDALLCPPCFVCDNVTTSSNVNNNDCKRIIIHLLYCQTAWSVTPKSHKVSFNKTNYESSPVAPPIDNRDHIPQLYPRLALVAITRTAVLIPTINCSVRFIVISLLSNSKYNSCILVLLQADISLYPLSPLSPTHGVAGDSSSPRSTRKGLFSASFFF